MNMNSHTNAELLDIHFINGLANGKDVLLFSCWGKVIQRDGNQLITHFVKCITTWRNIDLSESRLKVLRGREQHEHPFLKRVCCMPWTEISVTVYGRLLLQPEDLVQLSIVYCRVKPYIRLMYR
ncbi:hypothetical protein TNCV_371 [Trichonephila clavipes]|nr:hypothetical protein TNCV_371 [Trichonephila clavipes]